MRISDRSSDVCSSDLEKGWPTISAVGEKASHAAWLLAQHADDDPALQVRALRLMEPLAKAGEASKSNYAYLYDLVMLKLAGKQRYATQFGGCETGQAIRPLRRSEEHTSELQSLMRNSYAVFCLKKKTNKKAQ